MTTKTAIKLVSILILCSKSILSFSQIDTTSLKSNQSRHTFVVNTDKANFYTAPSLKTIRKAYLVKGNIVAIFKIDGDFGYSEFQNNAGMLTKGWLLIQDLSPVNVKINKIKTSTLINGYTSFDAIYNIAISDSLYEDYFDKKIGQIHSFQWLGYIKGYATYTNTINNKEIIQFLDQYRSIKYTFVSHFPDQRNFIVQFILAKGYRPETPIVTNNKEAHVKEIFTNYNKPYGMEGYSYVSINEIFTDGKRTGCEVIIKNPDIK